MGDAVTYVLTRILPVGQEKTHTREHPRKSPAAKQAARSHHANTGGMGSEMDGIYEALMAASPGETVGPFSGYHYRIDHK
jgi:hypothetical protein